MRLRSVTMLALIATGIMASAVVVAAAPGWPTFKHPQMGFSLSYPKDWAKGGEVSGVAFMVFGPDVAGLQGLKLSVNVTREEVPAGTSVDEYQTAGEAALQSIFNGYRRHQLDRVKIGTFPAMIRHYTWKTNNGIELYQLQLTTVDRTHAYTVTGTTSTLSSHLDDEVKLLTSILLTFRPR